MMNEGVPRKHASHTPRRHFETVEQSDMEGKARIRSPRMVDEGGNLVNAVNRATALGEMSGPMAGAATDVEYRPVDLVGPRVDEVPIS